MIGAGGYERVAVVSCETVCSARSSRRRRAPRPAVGGVRGRETCAQHWRDLRTTVDFAIEALSPVTPDTRLIGESGAVLAMASGDATCYENKGCGDFGGRGKRQLSPRRLSQRRQ